jgi:D-alanine-D-alanine ligase
MRPESTIRDGVPKRVAIVYNAEPAPQAQTGEELGVDDAEPPQPSSKEADAEVAEVAEHVRAVLERHGHFACVIPVVDHLDDLPALFEADAIDTVFNLVEALNGDARREPEMARLCEALRLPYTGNGPGIMRLALAKDMAKRLLASHGVPVALGYAVLDATDLADPAEQGLAYPVFVKPARTDASIGIDRHSVCKDFAAVRARVAFLSRHLTGPFVIEEYLPGREINVAILPDPFTGQCVPTEIDFTGYPDDIPPIVTYDCKWTPDCPESVAHSVPARDRLTPALYAEVCRIARAAFLALGGTSYGRVDMRLDAAGTPRVIDINPNCDIHPEAGMSIAAASVGYTHDALVLAVLAGASLKARHVPAPHLVARPRVVGHVASAH